MMRFNKTKLDGVIEIEHEQFTDFRGEYVEIFNAQIFKENAIDVDFVQDDISVSTKHVLRGIHGDAETCKLVSCLVGKFYIVVVNNNPESAQYKQWQGFTLSESTRKQLFIPAKFGNGHVVMSDLAMFHYKQNTYYNPGGQFTIRWDDPNYGIWWPIKNPILSRRDEAGKFVG